VGGECNAGHAEKRKKPEREHAKNKLYDRDADLISGEPLFLC
jgi:hypothetical protein